MAKRQFEFIDLSPELSDTSGYIGFVLILDSNGERVVKLIVPKDPYLHSVGYKSFKMVQRIKGSWRYNHIRDNEPTQYAKWTVYCINVNSSKFKDVFAHLAGTK